MLKLASKLLGSTAPSLLQASAVYFLGVTGVQGLVGFGLLLYVDVVFPWYGARACLSSLWFGWAVYF